MKHDDSGEPSDTNKPTKVKRQAVSGRTPGKVDAKGRGRHMRLEDSQQVKKRQSSKLKELSDALVVAGFLSLDEQAMALGLSRSTTWTILKAKHKNYGLSGALINRILQRPGLDQRVRAKLIEYVEEKASGYYGHNETQLRRFKKRLSARAAIPPAFRKMLNTTTNRADPARKKRDYPTPSQA